MYARYDKITEHDKKDFNRMDSSDDTSVPPFKRLRPGFTEPIVKTGGIVKRIYFTLYQMTKFYTCLNSIQMTI